MLPRPDKSKPSIGTSDYYTSKGDDRNDPLRNPGVLFQNLAFEKSIVEALRSIRLDKSWKILDVGCGAGFSMLRLLSYGLEPDRLHGIDIAENRIARGRKRQPTLNFTLGDATAMEFPSDTFDLAMESTMFVQITDDAMAAGIAQEMVRVVKPGGYIMLTDWRYSFGRKGYLAVTPERTKRLFGDNVSLVCRNTERCCLHWVAPYRAIYRRSTSRVPLVPVPGRTSHRGSPAALISLTSNTCRGHPRFVTFSIARPTHSVVVAKFGNKGLHSGYSGAITT